MNMQIAALLGSSALLAALAPTTAQACKCAVGTISEELSYPRADASEVPIDVAPVVRIRGYLGTQATVKLQAQDGHEVAFELRKSPVQVECSSLLELVPESPLAADTHYTITVENEGMETDLSFTTGSTRVPERPLEVPNATVSYLDLGNRRSSCSDPVVACLGAGESELEFIAIKAGRQIGWWLERGTRLIDRARELPDCVEIRARDEAGRRSEPQRLCGKQLNSRVLRESDLEKEHPRCEQGRFGDDVPDPALTESQEDSGVANNGEDGCSTSGTRAGGGPWAALALLLGLARRRNSRLKRPA